MTSEKMNACKHFVVFILSVFFSLNLFAKMPGQHEIPDVNVGSNCHGYLEYLPVGYDPGGSSRYPLLINIMGLGTTGDGSLASLNNLYNIHGGNPHDQANDGNWPDAFTLNGQTFQFVVITPQFMQNMLDHIPTPSEVNEVIDYIVQHYKIDTSRIYLIGSSQGAGAVWDYAGGGSQYAKRLAAIIPFAGVSFPFQEKANIMKFGKVAVWGFHNDLDNSVPSSFTKDYVNFYNNAPTPFGLTAKKTIFPSTTAHECWYNPLMRIYKDNGMDIYQWMLQFQSTPTTANAGNDQEIVLPLDNVQLTASGTAPDGTAASYHWEEYFGPSAAGTITSPNSSTTTVTNLSQGSYIFKLTITGNNASTAVDYVAITVNPTQQRIEDNSFINWSGVTINNSTTESSNGNLTRINDINNNDWISYSVTVGTAGTYRFRFRVGTFYGNTRFKVQNSDGTQDLSAPVTMYTTNWDVYMNLYADVNLQAGTQTIRITNYPNTGATGNIWYLNWFEVINNTQAVYSSGSTLPVTFSMFNVNCSNNHVALTWKTANEINSSEFIIEKSVNGREWNSIASVAASGQSSTEKNYSYADPLSNGNDFYRIGQKDNDGKITYTSILKNNCNSKQTFAVFPNPVNDKATITVSSNQNTKLNLSIIDSKGGVVRKQQTILPQGNNQVIINLSGLAKGIYTLQAEWNKEIKTTKLIKN
jgi:dienelactone hydrolase